MIMFFFLRGKTTNNLSEALEKPLILLAFTLMLTYFAEGDPVCLLRVVFRCQRRKKAIEKIHTDKM